MERSPVLGTWRKLGLLDRKLWTEVWGAMNSLRYAGAVEALMFKETDFESDLGGDRQPVSGMRDMLDIVRFTNPH